MRPLTDRQHAFLAALFADPRQCRTRAAAVAGYAWPGKQGSRLASFPAVAAEIRAEAVRCRKAFNARLREEDRKWAAETRRLSAEMDRQPKPPGYRGAYKPRKFRRMCM